MNDDKRTAYHEAGHAVVAYLLGVWLQEASIVPEGDTEGHVEYDDPLQGISLNHHSSWAWLPVEKQVEVYLAGPVAQRLFDPKSPWHENGEQDYAEARNTARRLTVSPQDAEMYLTRLESKVERILSDPPVWFAVTALANRLLQHKQLSGNQLRAFLNRALSHERKNE